MKKIILLCLIIGSVACHKNSNVATESVKETNLDEQKIQLKQVWATDSIFKTPESVIYDKAK